MHHPQTKDQTKDAGKATMEDTDMNAPAILPDEKVSPAEMRARIMRLETAMLCIPAEQRGESAFVTKHHFAPGVYMRELFIPKGAVLTGKIHKTEHLNILSQGDLTVWTEDGMKRLKASTVIKSQPGMKRVGYAHEDSVWITVHHNPENEQDIEKLEARLVTNSFEELTGSGETEKLHGGDIACHS